MKSTLKIVHRGINDLGAKNLNELFIIYTPNRALRSTDQKLLLPPCTNLKCTERDIAIRGGRYWNQVKLELKVEPKTDAFKIALKPYGTGYMESG